MTPRAPSAVALIAPAFVASVASVALLAALSACSSTRGRDVDNGALVARDAANHVLVVGNAIVDGGDAAQARGVALANLHAELVALCERVGPKLKAPRNATKLKIELLNWRAEGLAHETYEPVVIGVRERGSRTQARAVVDVEALLARFGGLLDAADQKSFVDEARLLAQLNEREVSLARYDTTKGAVAFGASATLATPVSDEPSEDVPPPPPPAPADESFAIEEETP